MDVGAGGEVIEGEARAEVAWRGEDVALALPAAQDALGVVGDRGSEDGEGESKARRGLRDDGVALDGVGIEGTVEAGMLMVMLGAEADGAAVDGAAVEVEVV